MKKVKVLDVVNIKNDFNGVTFHGAPLEDVKKWVKFRGEINETVTLWATMCKEAIEKLNGETITDDELDKHLNEVLGEEAMREVEITPFSFSEDAEAIILANIHIPIGRWEWIKMVLEPEETKEE